MRRAKPILDEHPLGPWKARVTVTPLEDLALPRRSERAVAASRAGRPGDVRFEVCAQWTGPGLPPAPGDSPLPGIYDVSDVAIVDDAESARVLARRAGEKLRVGEIPDLRELSRAA